MDKLTKLKEDLKFWQEELKAAKTFWCADHAHYEMTAIKAEIEKLEAAND